MKLLKTSLKYVKRLSMIKPEAEVKMGGFFLTNDTSALEKATSIFSKKGLANHTLLKMGPTCYCLYFSKWNVRDQPIIDQYFYHNEDVIISTGLLIYRDTIGTPALKLLYEDWNQFPRMLQETRGHFNLVAYINGKLTVITDKTSIYHSYYATYKNMFYISSSFLCVVDSLPKLTLSRQEALEFICTSNWYGDDTIFREIKLLPGGMLIVVDQGIKMEPYFKLSFEGEAYTIEQSYRFISEQLSWLKNTPPRISVDLTGGRDTRLIVAIMKSLGVNFRCYINTEPDKPDVMIARRIAERENMALDIFDDIVPTTNEDFEIYKNQVKKMFYLFDGCRSVFAAAVEINIHEYIADRADIRISGHGTELTRNYDWQKEYTGSSWNAFFDHILSAQIFPDMREYKENLRAKIIKITPISDRLTFLDINKIYYLTRCMYWAAARVTMSNQYHYLYIPFEDFSLTRFLFGMPAKMILNDSFHRKLIAKFDHRLNRYRYDRANPSSVPYRMLVSVLPESVKKTINQLLTLADKLKQGQVIKDISYHKSPFYLQKNFIASMIGKEHLLVTDYFGVIPDKQTFSIQDNIYTLELLLRYVWPKLHSS